LKYPYPEPPHQPQTFVEDAVYLRENLCREGGSKLVWKYSGREPSPYSSASRPATPISARDQDQRASWSRSPLPSPAKLLQHQQRVESLLQGAAKGVLERGERLGINKAVRDAVVEARKNLQNLQTPQLPRRVSDLPRRSGEDGPMAHPMGVMNALEHRNKQLSQLLGEALHDLREASASQDKVAAAQKNAIDIAVAKIQFVQVYLEDSTMPLPLQAVSQAEEDPPSATAGHEPRLQPGPSSQTEGTPQDSPTLPTKPNIDLQSPPPASPTIGSGQTNVSLTPAQSISQAPAASMSQTPIQSPSPASRQVPDSSSITPATPPATNVTTQSTTHRPRAPIPTRSSLAQSSFAFMLEPTESSSSSAKPWTPKTSTAKTSSPFLASHRRPLSISAREKNKAFLFGEEPNDEEADTRRPTMRNDKKEEFDLDSIGNRSKKGR
jgi:TBC1 domain family protein 5